MTTITIDDETKKALLEIAAKLQIKIKEKVDYNAAIKYLILKEVKTKDQIKLMKACGKVNGIDAQEVIYELYNERKKDELSLQRSSV
jgi:hypothetical protein